MRFIVTFTRFRNSQRTFTAPQSFYGARFGQIQEKARDMLDGMRLADPASEFDIAEITCAEWPIKPEKRGEHGFPGAQQEKRICA